MINVTRARALAGMLRRIATSGAKFTLRGWNDCTIGHGRRDQELQLMGFPEGPDIEGFRVWLGLSTEMEPRLLRTNWEDSGLFDYQPLVASDSIYQTDPAGIADWLDRQLCWEAWDAAHAEAAIRNPEAVVDTYADLPR